MYLEKRTMYKFNQTRRTPFFLFTLLLEFNDVIQLHVPLRIQLPSTETIQHFPNSHLVQYLRRFHLIEHIRTNLIKCVLVNASTARWETSQGGSKVNNILVGLFRLKSHLQDVLTAEMSAIINLRDRLELQVGEIMFKCIER